MEFLNYFAVVLAAMWSLGCFFLPLKGVYHLWQDNETALCLALLLIGWPLCIVIGILPWMVYAENQSPDLATLKKNEWTCSQSHTVVTTTMIMAGKTMVPVVTSHQECDQYNKK